jgi:hypothetical protein
MIADAMLAVFRDLSSLDDFSPSEGVRPLSLR